jgi:hypothetical protein
MNVYGEVASRETIKALKRASARSWTADRLLYFTAVQDRKRPLPIFGDGLSPAVELRGFEPLTPSMRTRCATGLRHNPNRSVHNQRTDRRSG